MIDIVRIAQLLVGSADEVASLIWFLQRNCMYDISNNELYRYYNPDNRGCNCLRPYFLVEYTINNIVTELAFIKYLFRFAPGRDASYEFVSHEPDFNCNFMFMDKITLNVTENGKSHYECYWFGMRMPADSEPIMKINYV